MASSIHSVETAGMRKEKVRRKKHHTKKETDKVRRKAEFLTPPTHLYHHVSVLYTCPYTFLPITVHVMAQSLLTHNT